MKHILLVLLVLFPIILLSRASATEPVLRVGINTFPANLNPVFVTDETSQAVVNKIFDALFEFDPNGNIVNCLAESYRYESETEIHLRLKEKIYFSNGIELTAADVEATFDLLLDERYKYPYAANLRFIDSFNSAGKYQLILKTKHPAAAWRNAMTFKILCSMELEKTEPSNFRQKQLSGTGPYMLAKSEPPNRVILELNPRLKDATMHPTLHYTVVAYPYLAPLKLLNREIDVCELQPEDVPVYRQKKSWQESFDILKYRKFGYTYLVFNLQKPAISARVRQVMYNVLVSGPFTEKFLQGRGEALDSPIMLLNSKVDAEPFAVERISPPVKLKILTNSESQMRKRFILFMKRELAAFAIELEPVFLEYHSFLDCLKQKKFDLALSGFLLDIDYDVQDILAKESYFNYAGFSSQEMDRLLSEGLIELDPQKREEIYQRVHTLWKRHLPILPLFNLYYYVAVSKEVSLPEETIQLMGSNGDFLQNIRQWLLKPRQNSNGE